MVTALDTLGAVSYCYFCHLSSSSSDCHLYPRLQRSSTNPDDFEELGPLWSGGGTVGAGLGSHRLGFGFLHVLCSA